MYERMCLWLTDELFNQLIMKVTEQYFQFPAKMNAIQKFPNVNMLNARAIVGLTNTLHTDCL